MQKIYLLKDLILDISPGLGLTVEIDSGITFAWEKNIKQSRSICNLCMRKEYKPRYKCLQSVTLGFGKNSV